MYDKDMPKKTQLVWLEFFAILGATPAALDNIEDNLHFNGLVLEDDLLFANNILGKLNLPEQIKAVKIIADRYATNPYSAATTQRILVGHLQSLLNEFGSKNVSFNWNIQTNEPSLDFFTVGPALEAQDIMHIRSMEIQRATGSLLEVVFKLDFDPNALELYLADDVPKITSNEKIGTGRLRLDDRKLVVDLPEQGEVIFATYKTGNPPHTLMQYLFAQPNGKVVSNTEVQKLAGCEDYRDLQTAMRTCGFDKHVKPLFFPNLRKERLTLIQEVPITRIELNYILANAEKNEEKRKKTKVT